MSHVPSLRGLSDPAAPLLQVKTTTRTTCVPFHFSQSPQFSRFQSRKTAEGVVCAAPLAEQPSFFLPRDVRVRGFGVPSRCARTTDMMCWRENKQ